MFISLYILYTAKILAYPVIPYAYELDITISRISRYYIYICPRRKIRDRFYGSLLHTLNVASMLFFVLGISDTDGSESCLTGEPESTELAYLVFYISDKMFPPSGAAFNLQ